MSRFTSQQTEQSKYASSTSTSLLPKEHFEFSKESYWDNFFKQRGSKSFEWYGVFQDFSYLIRQYVPNKNDSFLVIGCGNSEFSSFLYDDKYNNITNIDYVPDVIAQMKQKNEISRPRMKWLVADMTDMKEISESSYNNIFDKGALDALLSENSSELQEASLKLYTEIHRILVNNGQYFCITLAQDFVISSLINFFVETSSYHYEVIVDVIKNSKPSSMIPFFITCKKVDSKSKNVGLIGVRFDSFGGQLSTVNYLTNSEAIKLINSVQEYHSRVHSLLDLIPGRFQTMDFFVSSESGNMSSNLTSTIPRFTFLILDIDKNTKTRICAVFIVPTGRESEYQFSTQNGLKEIAVVADCNRFFVVRCNKPHTFRNITTLQDELSPIVLKLIPSHCNPVKDTIPYLSLEEENNWEEIKHDVTDVSGEYIVEEKSETMEDGNDDTELLSVAVLRRLIFLQNQNFIQTECRLLLKSKPDAAVSNESSLTKSKLKRLKKKASANKSLVTDNADTSVSSLPNSHSFDYSYMDDHHRAMLASFSLLITFSNPTSVPWRGLLVGLGGGSLPNCLQYYFSQSHLTVIELDGQIEEIAKEYFGFQKSSKTVVIVDDGMEYIRKCSVSLRDQSGNKGETNNTSVDGLVDERMNNVQLRDVQTSVNKQMSNFQQFSYIIIDVDGKDSSLGLSAPPQSFIENNSLCLMYDLLEPYGLLILNVVARGGDGPVNDLLQKLKQTFQNNEFLSKNNNYSKSENTHSQNMMELFDDGTIHLIKPAYNTVNIVIVAQKGASSKSRGKIKIDNITSKMESEETICHTNASNLSKEASTVEVEIDKDGELCNTVSNTANNNEDLLISNASEINNKTDTNVTESVSTNKKKQKAKKKATHRHLIEISKITNDDLKRTLESFMTHHLPNKSKNSITGASANNLFSDELNLLSLIDSFEKL